VIYTHCINETDGYGKTPASYINDREIVESIRDLINSADVLVHHYGDRFDLRFLNTRCLEHGISPPAPIATIDTWRIARDNLAMTSNRLKTLGESFSGIQKGELSKEDWKLAVHGDPDVLARMQQYCIDDVRVTTEVYLTLLPLIKNHPYIGGIANYPVQEADRRCPFCQSTHTQAQGWRRTKCFQIRRMKCNDCGTWYQGERKKVQ